MTLHVAQGMDVLEKCMGHEQARRAVGYIVSQGNLQVLWDGGAPVFFRRMLALSNVDIKLSVLLGLGIGVSHGFPPSPKWRCPFSLHFLLFS